VINIGMVGHLRDYKGWGDFLAVAQVLTRDGGARLRFHIVGEGPERDVLRTTVQALGLSDVVVFHGLQQNIWPILDQLDLFLFTSLREGLSVAVIEAMSANLPIVASDVGGIADQVLEGENGYILPVADIDGFAAACRKLIGSAQKRREFGQRSYALYRDRFSQSRMLNEYVDVYRRAVG
jgi:glycosyltransferase involved in cell wall biosynthesis